MSIICFGSMNIDHVYDADHILKPGETLESSHYKLCDGGKGLNQAIALGRAGADCRMAGMLGHDGRGLLAALSSSKVDTDLIRFVEGPSGHTIIQVDRDGQNCILYHGGANKAITHDYIDEVMSQCSAGDYILLQNEISMLAEIIKAADKQGLKIVLNPSPISNELKNLPLDRVSILILNEIEGYELTKREEPLEILAELRQKYPDTAILLTLGKRGSIYQDAEITAHQDIFQVPVVDTTAAGDTFTGFFLKMLMDGEPIPTCLRYASTASAIAVGKQGAAQSIPTFAEVENSPLLK